jgi:hypothetical protein
MLSIILPKTKYIIYRFHRPSGRENGGPNRRMSNLSPLQGREADEVAIRALSQQLNEAWGNADAFAAAFTEDADYITFDGALTSGRAANAQVPLRADHGCSQARGTLAVYGFPQYTLSPIHSHALWAPADALRPTSGYKSLSG